MKQTVLQGAFTALATPFLPAGEIDFPAFEKLIEFQIANGVEGIVVGGSTGENFALNFKEKTALLVKAIEIADGRTKIIAGTGTNETKQSCDNTLLAKELGADAALVVAPYYNKPSQDALFEHYRLIAETAEGLPIIVYNIPGRSAVNINSETVLRIAEECDNVRAIKEASADLEQMMEIIRNAPEDFSLLSGDDYLTLPVILMGGKGVISTITNYAPKQFGDLTRFALAGDYSKALKIHYELFDLMNLNFIESNPGPVKYILSKMGMIHEVYRMPIMQIKQSHKNMINEALIKCGFIK
jgi:4-hydroxy-tetrahydrodipicolinate synthase